MNIKIDFILENILFIIHYVGYYSERIVNIIFRKNDKIFTIIIYECSDMNYMDIIKQNSWAINNIYDNEKDENTDADIAYYDNISLNRKSKQLFLSSIIQKLYL